MEDIKLHQNLMKSDSKMGLDSHRYSEENHHLYSIVYQVKLFFILTIGCIILLIGILFIISECSRKCSYRIGRRKGDRERLIGRRVASEHVISLDSVKNENEYFL